MGQLGRGRFGATAAAILVVWSAAAAGLEGCRRDEAEGASGSSPAALRGVFETREIPADARLYARLGLDGKGGYTAKRSLCRFDCLETGTYTYDPSTQTLALTAANGSVTTLRLTLSHGPTGLAPRDLLVGDGGTSLLGPSPEPTTTSPTSFSGCVSRLVDPAGESAPLGSSCVPVGTFTLAENDPAPPPAGPEEGTDGGAPSVRKIPWSDVGSIKLLSNLKAPKEIVVSWLSRLQAPFVTDLACRAEAEGVRFTVVAMHDRLEDARAAMGSLPCGAHVDLVEVDNGNDSVFIQDFGEIVDHGGRTAILDLAHPNFTPMLSEKLAARLGADVIVPPYDRQRAYTSGDIGGNVEGLPGGGVYFGDAMGEQLQGFLGAHAAPSELLRTSWLLVGHVDEYVGIIPANTSCGRSVVHADTVAALNLFATMSPAELAAGTAAMNADCGKIEVACKSIDFAELTLPSLLDSVHYFLKDKAKAPPWVIGDFDLAVPPRKLALRADIYVRNNLAVQQNEIMASAARLAADPDVRGSCSDDEILTPVPMLFRAGGGGAIADTAGVANFIVLGDLVIAPDPYFPSFRTALTATISRRGPRVETINDFVYHFLEGEVHCGTQVVRAL